jgi:hypothetical protein
MKNKMSMLALAAGLLMAGAGSAMAHHSYAMFDKSKTETINGTVRTVQWTNPHVYVWLYVPNDKGTQDIWGIEFGGGPNGLERHGWTKHTLNVGDKISLKINPLKDGRTGGLFLEVTLPNGKKMTMGGGDEKS